MSAAAQVNSPLAIAVIVIAAWAALGLVVLIGKGSELLDRSRADIDAPIELWPADVERDIDQAVRLANDGWTALDDAQAQRWIRHHPAN